LHQKSNNDQGHSIRRDAVKFARPLNFTLIDLLSNEELITATRMIFG